MRQSAVGLSTAETFVICMTPLLEMDAENIPRVIPPAGLSDERRRYLFKHVRPLLRIPFRDTMCPDHYSVYNYKHMFAVEFTCTL